MKIYAIIIVIFAGFFLSAETDGISGDFNPTVMKIEGTPSIEYAFSGRELSIPFTLTGTSAGIWLVINTCGQAENISKVRNSYLGWHYVNKIDTTIYISQHYSKSPGDNVIVWDGRDENGNLAIDGEYDYYLWGYDEKSPRQLASKYVMPGFNWESQFTSMIENDTDGFPLANPMLFGSQAWWIRQPDPAAPDYSWKAHGTTFKWLLGSDPEDLKGLQTTRCTGYDDSAKTFSYGGPALDPHNFNNFYHCSVDMNNKITTVLKWDFVPDGEAVKNENWGNWDNITLEDHGMAAGRWSQKPSCYTDGNYIYQVSPGLYQKDEEWNKLRVYNIDDGSVVMDKMMNEWYMPGDKNPYGYINGSFNKMASRFQNQWLLTGYLSCMHEMINTSRLVLDADDETDMVMWRNSNGDYFLDNAFLPDAGWYCLEKDDDWHRRRQTDSVSIDSNGFNIFGQSYLGMMSFAVSTQDGSAMSYMRLADDSIGDAPYKNGGYILCDSGTAYDGLYMCSSWYDYDYLDNWQLPDMDGFIGNSDLNWISRRQTCYVAFDSYHGTIRHWGDGPYVILDNPKGGEKLLPGNDFEIRWFNTAGFDKITNSKIEYTTNNGNTWIKIIENANNHGSYIWSVPDVISDKCMIRITETIDYYDIATISSNTFSIGENIDFVSSGNPSVFSVSQNSPNPFNPSTTIDIVVPSRNIVKAEIYNIYGSKVSVLADGVFEPGKHNLKWNASGLSAGVYFCKLSFGEKTRTIRMTLVK